jgi:hypothetical protein
MEFHGIPENNSIIHPKKEVIQILYDNLPPISEFIKKRKITHNKYTELALKYGYSNYRVCTLAELHSLKLMKSFTDNQKQFFNDNGEFLVIFNEIGGKPVSLVFRSLKIKQFIDYSMFYTVYGLDLINPDFKFGKWMILTEGIYDADSFRVIHKDILAMLTSNITLMQAEVLTTLTDKFILAFDNDDGGRAGVTLSTKRLKDLNPKIQIEVMPLYSTDKDLGILEELSHNPEDYMYRKIFYESFVFNTLNTEGFGL